VVSIHREFLVDLMSDLAIGQVIEETVERERAIPLPSHPGPRSGKPIHHHRRIEFKRGQWQGSKPVDEELVLWNRRSVALTKPGAAPRAQGEKITSFFAANLG
jgi:hypothetical protein